MNKTTVIYPVKVAKDCKDICHPKCCEHLQSQLTVAREALENIREQIPSNPRLPLIWELRCIVDKALAKLSTTEEG